MCMQDGTVVVGPIIIGRGAMVGHLVMIGPNNVLGEGAELGASCAIGIGAIGARARIGR